MRAPKSAAIRFVQAERCFFRNSVAGASLTVVALIAAGCASDGKPSARARSRDNGEPSAAAKASLSQVSPLSNTDPCAMRLHDLCGALLMYYFTNDRLPDRLDELANLPGLDEPLQFSCPVTHTPYIYTVDGITIPERKTRIVLYDPSPAHSGLRWAVSIDEPRPGEPLVTKVLALPESFFVMRPPMAP